MSVSKIALGVFLGNLATALLSWLVISIVWQSQASDASLAASRAQLKAIEQQYPEAAAAAERNAH